MTVVSLVKRLGKKLLGKVVKKVDILTQKISERRSRYAMKSRRSSVSTASSDDSTATVVPRQQPSTTAGNSSRRDQWKGTVGRPLHVVTNHVELRYRGSDGSDSEDGDDRTMQVHQYHLTFFPEDMPIYWRKKIIYSARPDFGGPIIYDAGFELYCTKKFVEDGEAIKLEQKVEEKEYAIIVKYTKTMPLDSPVYMQIYNLIVKTCLYGMGLDEIGSSFFDSDKTYEYPQLKVQLWPGYTTGLKYCENGLLLCVDITHKVIRNDDLLTHIEGLRTTCPRDGSRTLEDFILDDIKGHMVITPYNKNSYRIEGIKLDANPRSMFKLKDGSETSFIDYYKNRYHLQITKPNQPLVIALPTKKMRKGKREEELILVPEFCLLTGLTDDMRANMGIMKMLAKHLHMEPKERIKAVQDFMTRLNGTPACQQILAEWGFELKGNLMQCTTGRVLPTEQIFYADGKFARADDKNDWTRSLRTNQLLRSVSVRNWIVIVADRDAGKAKEFVQVMMKVARPLGFVISEPKSYGTIPDTRLASYMRSLERIVHEYPKDYLQMVLCVLPNNKADLYCAIKRRLSQDFGIQSQCLLLKNLMNAKAAMSIATKLVIQMTTKLGAEPWTLEFHPKLKNNTIAVGFDTYKRSGSRGAKVGTLVASMNGDYSKYFSIAFSYQSECELETALVNGIVRVVEMYSKTNEAIPTTIIFYRIGVMDGTRSTGEIQVEADKIQASLNRWTDDHEVASLHFVYILLTRQTIVRVMTHKGNCQDTPVLPVQLCNPPPGTVVDKNIVEMDGREFYLVPTNARQGTVRPIQYRIIIDTLNAPADVIQGFTYKMCHLYYNWTGTVNLPAVCQYAGKLAKQTAQALPNCPHERLSHFLHYL